MPDYIVLQEKLVIYNISLQEDYWFADHYKPVRKFPSERFEQLGGDPLIVLQRVHDFAPMIEQTTEIELWPGLTLDSFAIDERQLKAGDWMRVKLNLRLHRSADSGSHDMVQPLNITTDLVNKKGEVVAAPSTFHTEYWAEDEVSPIYTPIQAPDSLAPGAYFLWVRVEGASRTPATLKLTAITVESGPER